MEHAIRVNGLSRRRLTKWALIPFDTIENRKEESLVMIKRTIAFII